MKKLLLLVLVVTAFSGFAQSTCATALPLQTGTIPDITGTYGAGCFTSAATNGMWYTYTPASRGVLRINTNLATNDGIFNSDDTRISVFTGTCAALTPYICVDDVDDTNYLTDFEVVVDANVTYYVQFDSRWSPAPADVEVTFTAANCPSTAPYQDNFATIVDYACWRTFNVGNDGPQWGFNGVNDFDGNGTDDGAAMIFPQAATNAPKDDWLISKAISMTAGATYTVSIKYNGFNNPVPANESFRTVMLDSPSPTAMGQTLLGTTSNIVQAGTFGTPTFVSSAPVASYNFTPIESGDYYLGIHAQTAAAGGILIIMNVDVQAPLSVGEVTSNTFSVYPNPASDAITISNDQNVMVSNVAITDMNGRVVKQVNAKNEPETRINVSDLSAGIYMLTINSESGSITKKFVKS